MSTITTHSYTKRLSVILALLGLLAAAMYFIEGPAEMNDFEVYHRAGDRFRHGQDLYLETDGHFEFKYLPIAAAFFVPISLLPLAIAKPVWLILLVAAIGVSFERLWRAFPGVHVGGAAILGLVLARCFEREFANGQINGILLLLVVVGFERVVRGDDRLAGLLLSLAGLFKPHFFAFIPYLFLMRRYKAASAGLIVLSAGLLAPTLRYGSERLILLHRTMSVRLADSTPRLLPDTANASLPGLLAKLLHVTPPLATLGGLLLVGFALYAPLRRLRADRAIDVERPWDDLAVLMPALLLISPQAWDFTAFMAAASLFLFVAMRASLPKALLVLGVSASVVLAVDMKLLLGSGPVFLKVMHFSPNAWVLLAFLAIAIYLRLSPRKTP